MSSKPIYILICIFYILVSCNPTESKIWKEELKEYLPLLGHRNWIIITDMAYPLQNRAGIKTIYTNEPYIDVLSFVHSEIGKSAHIKPIIHQDKELCFLSDSEVKGIDNLKNDINEVLNQEVIYSFHNDLISQIDEISKTFNVLILKTNLVYPYTSTFIELDCGYWDKIQEDNLLEKIVISE